MEEIKTKKCAKCGAIKPLEDFPKLAKSPDGRNSYCKECQKAYTKQWVADHPERAKATAKKSRDKHKDALTKKRRKDRAEKPEVFLKYSRDFSEKNPDKILLYEARKRAKEFGLPCTITEEDIVIPEFCPILRVRLIRGAIDNNRDSCPSLDRIRPELGYVKGNVAVMSYRANRIKNDATADEHRRIADWMDAQTQSTQEFNVIDPELIEFGRGLGERLLENTKRAIDEAVTGLAQIPVGSYFDKNPRLAPMSLSPAQTKEAA